MQSYKLISSNDTHFACTLARNNIKKIFGFDPKLDVLKDDLANIDPLIWRKNIRKEQNIWPDGTRPLNRAALKFDEIATTYNLFNLNEDVNDSKTFICLCEGPGGFMECILKRRENAKLIGITLKPDNANDKYFVPDWKVSGNGSKSNNHISVQYGADGTGNLYKVDNIIHFISNNPKSHFVTADGGFDVSPNWNMQEQLSAKLIWCQIVCAFGCQEVSDTSVFILKMFDTFTVLSAKMLYILSVFYKAVNICKPEKSRESNSERYIVCIGFKGVPMEAMNNFFGIINGWPENDSGNISDICTETIIPPDFIESLTFINENMCQKQIACLELNINKCSDNGKGNESKKFKVSDLY